MWTIIGDPHAKPDNLEKIEQLFDLIERLGNDCIILGDLLDTKEVVRGKCLNTYLKRMAESKLSFTLLVGNHDWFNLECKEHSLESLKNLPNVSVVDKPLRSDRYLFLPYVADHDKFRKILDDTDAEVVFCHADVKGFDYGNGLVSTDGLGIDDFGKFKAVISGHYHKYQTVGKVTYLGTPFSHSFGESNQVKYIGVFNEDTSLKLIETPFPRHITLEVDCEKVTSLELGEKDYFRVVLKGTQEQINRFQKVAFAKYLEQPTDTLSQSIISETDSPQIQFQKWAKDIKGFSDDLISLGKEVLDDV